MDQSPNLQLSFLMAAQSQKHVTYNEAMRALDALVQQTVLDKDLAAPPASPDDGDRYIVAASPTGAWSGQAGKLAAWQDGAWAFYTPREGWLAWVADEDVLYVHDGAAWAPLSVSGGSGGAALDALAALTPAADRLPYFTGTSAAALAPFSAFGRSLVDDADAATARTTLGLTLGTDVQAYNANLAALAGLTLAADKLPYATGAGALALADFTSFGRSLVDDANAAAARTTLGLGTSATVDTGTSGTKVALTNGANTWSAAQTIAYSAAGATQFSIQDAGRSNTVNFAFNGTSGDGELKASWNKSAFNVMSFQNLNSAGFSAISFYAHDTAHIVERAAFGYGNTSAPAPFTGKAYFEASHLTDGVVDGNTNLILVTTGTISNFGGSGNFIRQEFDGNGDCVFYGGSSGTANAFRIDHAKGATSYGALTFDGLANISAFKTTNNGWSGSTSGSMLDFTNGGSGIEWNTTGTIYGLNLQITNTASNAASCAIKVTGAKVYFDASNSGDGPRASGLTGRCSPPPTSRPAPTPATPSACSR